MILLQFKSLRLLASTDVVRSTVMSSAEHLQQRILQLYSFLLTMMMVVMVGMMAMLLVVTKMMVVVVMMMHCKGHAALDNCEH